MAISIIKLHQVLTDLEQKWFKNLSTSLPGVPLPVLANGYVQFFAMEMPCPTCGAGENRPECLPAEAEAPGKCPDCRADLKNNPGPLDGDFLIVCVGINYDQSVVGVPPWKPYLQTITGGRTWVVDNSWPVCRRAVNAALQEYRVNAGTWFTNGYASSATLALPPSIYSPPVNQPPFRFQMVMTNLSPFISTSPWAGLPAPARRAALTAWDRNHHICDLIAQLGDQVDLWIVHGKGHVWPTFNRKLKNWILTPQLGPQNLHLGWFEKFWKTKNPATATKKKSWPNCPAISIDAKIEPSASVG